MKKTKRKEQGRAQETKNRDVALLLVSVGFLLGGIFGGLAAGKLPAETYIQQFLQTAAQETMKPSLWRELWVVFRWPGAVIVLSLLPLVGLTIPLLFFLRAFLLSYGIVSLTVGTGLSGILCAGLLFGPTCLLTVPVLFVLGTEGLLRKAEETGSRRQTVFRAALCLLALCLCVFLDQVLVPPVLTWFLKALAAGT